MTKGTSLPEGILAFVFTDIENSTRMWEEQPDEMSRALKRHNALITSRFESRRGNIFKATGDGYCAAFAIATDAVQACVEVQSDLASENWDIPGGLRVRMAIHVGAAERMGDDFIGPTLNRAARVMDLGHGGQILLSSACHSLLTDNPPKGTAFKALGMVELAGLLRPEEIYQVCAATLLDDFPPLRTKSQKRPASAHNIEPDPRPFIGRNEEVRQLLQRLQDPAQRLVTITGMGGIGKTRLAKEIGREFAKARRDGACLVSCDVLSGREEIASATLSAIRAEPGTSDSETQLVETLRDREMLLIFDCFEGNLEAAELFDRLLRTAPHVQCLVTSRAVLGLDWEFEFALGPLSIRRGAENESDGVALFEEAAKHVHGQFRLGKRNRPAITALVKELEGVPLAILLAAGRLRHLSLTELQLQVKAHRLDILKRKPIGLDRHANLREVIQGSFDMLPADVRKLAIALSVFEGGFFLEDAIAVLKAWPEPLDGISRLRDHSLLVGDVSAGRMRYRALDTVREYLAQSADDVDLESVRFAHAHHFSAKAREVRSLFESGQWQAATSGLWSEAGNFRAAIRFATLQNEVELRKSFAASLARCYMEAGIRSEFLSLLNESTRIARETNDHAFLAEMLGLAGAFARRNGDYAGAKKHWSERMNIGEQTKDLTLEVDSLIDLADLALSENKFDEAIRLAGRYDSLERGLKPGFLRASGSTLKARIALQIGNEKEAAQLAESAMLDMRGTVPDTAFFYVTVNLVQVFRTLGESDMALSLCHQALSEAIRNSWPHFVVKALFELSETYARSNDIENAAKAVVVASMAPRSQVFSLRDEAKRRKSSFQAEYGERDLEAAAAWAQRSDWVTLATALAEREPSLEIELSDQALDLRLTGEG